jgi:RNA polymerase sigma factor (sigma-70 family)
MTSEQSLKEHAGLIALLARKYTWAGEYEDLHQIAQAAWVRGWDKAAETDKGPDYQRNYAALAARSALNRVGRRLFTESRSGTTLSLHELDSTGTPHIDRLPAPHRPAAYAFDELETLREQLAALPPKHRKLLTDIYLNSVPGSELAEREGVERNTIHYRLKTALRLLRLRYQEAVA